MDAPPEFAVGQPVRVVVSARNRTARTGRVRLVAWHSKLARWMFLLEVPGVRVAWRRVPKRYFADDLVAVTGPGEPGA